jgi:hypothetical protein
MRQILFWLVPPLIGALIGYVTNALAIKMLFRPLKAVKFFGLRLPFTPGILPRERHKLADSIGAMVERELLTPESLRERLLREDVRESLRKAVGGYTGRILESPVGGLLSGLDAGGGPDGADSPAASTGGGAASLAGDGPDGGGLFAGMLRDFLGSRGFDALLEQFLEALAEYLDQGEALASGDESRVSGPPAEGPRGILRRSLRDVLGEERIAALRANLERLIREGLTEKLPQSKGFLRPIMEKGFPVFAASTIGFLRRPEIHRELEVQGRVFLNSAILKLSMFQRFFVSAGQYDKTLRERMPEIIDDLIAQLEALLADGEIRERLMAYVEDMAGNLLSQGQSSEGILRFALDWIMAYGDRPLGGLIQGLTSREPRDLLGKIRDLIRENQGGGFGKLLGRTIKGFLENRGDLRVADFLAIQESRKEKIDALICDKLLDTATAQIESLLTTINVRTLVSQRIDSLDMIRVEHIVLDVMANQLKWINLFGGILGAFIGVFQSFFSWFTQSL